MSTPGRLRALLIGAVSAAVLAGAGCTGAAEPVSSPGNTPSASPPGSHLPSDDQPMPVPPATDNPFGAHWDWSRFEQFTPYLKKISGSATYHELSWCDIEKTQGQPDWSAVDRIAERSRSLGITLNLKIRTGVCWATGGTAQYTRGQANKTESAMPRDLATYQAFVRDLVTRYSPYEVRQYAVENEVNAPQYWAGSPDDYIRLVRAAAEAIHAADPAALVVDSGISSVAYGFGVVDRLVRAGRIMDAIAAYQAYFQRRVGTRGQKIPAVQNETQLRKALANQANVRNVSFLAATEKLLDERVVQLRQVHYYEHFSGVPALLEYLSAETPAGTPIEAWEVGQFWSDGDDDATGRAAEMVKVVSQLVAAGIRQVMWLPLAYNPNNRAGSEVRYGLLDPDGREREAGVILADLVTAARNATVTAISDGPLAGVAFQRGQETTLVVWSASGAPVTVPATAGLSSGPLGEEPRAASAPVPISATPVVLHGTGPPAALLAGAR